MLTRIILVLGVALMLFAGGAVAWQALRGGPAAVAGSEEGAAGVAPDGDLAAPPPGPFAGLVWQAPPAGVPQPAQGWLISPGGGLVPGRDVAAILRQGRFVEGRRAELALVLPVAALLAPGEAPPDPVFAQVFADIRAPLVALDLCRPLLETFAAGCRLALARANGYDAQTGTATFRIVLEFTQKPTAVPLPDLSQSALYQDATWDEVSGETPRDALQAAAERAVTLCATAEGAGRACRLTGLSLQWQARQARAQIAYGWFAPLPQGMFPAPPLPAAATQ